MRGRDSARATIPLAYDYHHQAWLLNRKYQGCAHATCHAARYHLTQRLDSEGAFSEYLAAALHPICYGTLHEGEPVDQVSLALDMVH